MPRDLKQVWLCRAETGTKGVSKFVCFLCVRHILPVLSAPLGIMTSANFLVWNKGNEVYAG